MLELPHYSSQLMQQLWALRIGEHFCDCTVFVGDSPHRAHKLLLAASSMIFRSALATTDTIMIDTSVVSSQDFSCLLEMVYTGKLPLGKHNVSRIIAAADSLQMFDLAIGFKKVLMKNLNPRLALSENAAEILSQNEIEMDTADATTANQELLPENEPDKEIQSTSERSPSTKDTSAQSQSIARSFECTSRAARGVGSDISTAHSVKEPTTNEQLSATALCVEKHSPMILELLSSLPAVRDLLRQEAERGLEKQDRQVVMKCCDEADPGGVAEALLSHARSGALSEAAFVTLLGAARDNGPVAFPRLRSVLQELEADVAAADRVKDSSQRNIDTEEDDNEEDKGTEVEEEESLTDDTEDKEPKKAKPKAHTCRFCKKSFAYKCRLQTHLKVCSKPRKRPLCQCPQCPEKLPSQSALLHHQVQAHKKKVECELCGRKFAHPSGMIYHMRSEHFDEKPFTCKECGARFSAKSSLKNHERRHTGEKPYVCKECDMSFAVAAGLAYHIKKKHAQGNMYVCQYCKAEFAQSIELSRHVRTHTGDRPYVCRECGKGFTQASQLTAHLESAHASIETFDCQKCFLSFSSLFEHTSHIQKHHPDEYFKCPACDKVFPNETLLNKHKSTHKGVKLFSCYACNKSYQQLSGLWYHNRTQHAEVFGHQTQQINALLQCDICFTFFPSEETLAQHHAIKHPDSSGVSFRCPLCPALFVGEDRMQEHITAHHAEQTETLCMHCFVRCGSVPELQDHMLTQHPENREEQHREKPEVSAEAPEQTAGAAEQVSAAECLLQPASSRAADFAPGESQSHLDNAQQVFVTLANGQAGSQVVEMSMFNLLNNSVTFICEDSAPGPSPRT